MWKQVKIKLLTTEYGKLIVKGSETNQFPAWVRRGILRHLRQQLWKLIVTLLYRERFPHSNKIEQVSRKQCQKPLKLANCTSENFAESQIFFFAQNNRCPLRKSVLQLDISRTNLANCGKVSSSHSLMSRESNTWSNFIRNKECFCVGSPWNNRIQKTWSSIQYI